MKIIVETHNSIIGFHNYPNAPEEYKYLESRHRHVFEIRCGFEVTDDNREIEFNDKQLDIENVLYKEYGYPCEFGGMSCEMIARRIISLFDCASCQVLEDGHGGATLTK